MALARSRRIPLLAALFVSALLSPTAHAQDDGSEIKIDEIDNASRHKTLITARGMAWLPELDGDVLNENGGGVGTTLDFASQLDIGETVAEAAWDIQLKFKKHEFRFSGFQFGVDGLDTAANAITFGNLVFAPGDLISTDFDATNLKLLHGFTPFSFGKNGTRVGLLLGVNFYDIDIDVTDIASVASDSISEQIPLPVIGGYAELPLGQFLISAEASGMELDIDSVDAFYLDVSASVTWRPLPAIGVFGGYRSITADLSTDQFDVDASLEGFFFGGEIRF